MKEKLTNLQNAFENALDKVQTKLDLDNLEDKFLGKKGELKEILKGIKDLTDEEKKEIGARSNELKNHIQNRLKEKFEELQNLKFKNIEIEEEIDVSLQFPSTQTGHMHPISITSKLLEDIFISLGFKVEDGPQIEEVQYNFDKLNIPAEHPARDVWDTFWITDLINKTRADENKYLLRTHTSPVQTRTMIRDELPIKIIVPGRVFRFEQEDARHTCNFYQIEGMVVGKGVTLGDLKWTLSTAMKKLLGEETEVRLRPSIFPFTEPSVEVDVSCQICKGKKENCKMCSSTGWVELLGAGIIHPKVLEYCGIDPEKYSGFAFGLGIDRIATQKFGISYAKNLYQSKLKLNEQF